MMQHLQRRLEEVLAEHNVPGAALGVLDGEDVSVFAAGITNKRTGVEVTPDTLFQIGSITKVWTATLVMMLVDEGLVNLDVPVVTYLPELRFAGEDVTAKVTLRHLLSHSSGIGGDHIVDTGRGDDTLERYVGTCAELAQEHELGATMSYCNTGYSVAGRIIEKLTGKVWDDVLRERLVEPLGLTHMNTLPEEAILFRTAAGHVKRPGHDEEQVTPIWGLPRSLGPAGGINSAAADLLAFVRLHLDEGRVPDGKQVLSAAAVTQMQEAQVEVPDRYTLGDRWGLGWILFDWGGRAVYGHNGSTIGQRAYLRVVPDTRVAACLLTNGGEAKAAFQALCGEIVRDRASVAMPVLPTVPDEPPTLDLGLYTGTYKRLNVEMEVRVAEGVGGAERRDSGLSAQVRSLLPVQRMLRGGQDPPLITLKPVDRSLFMATSLEMPTPTPMVFFDFDGDTPRRVHFGARAMTRS